MNIRNWPMDRIMQLPDCCFGRRWPIAFTAEVAGSAYGRFISPMALPERCVLWEIFVGGFSGANAQAYCEIALGDQDPLTNAIFESFEPLFQLNAGNVYAPNGIPILYLQNTTLTYRLPIITSGRRLAIRINNAFEVSTTRVLVSFLISSIPTEVPDWLISGQGRGR